MATLCCAAAWSPTARGPYGYGEGFELPFDSWSGALRPEVWARWLAWDPVRMIDAPRAHEAMRGMRAIYLDAGLNDEFNLQLGMRQFAQKLRSDGIAHIHEEFEGGHMNTQYRYDRSLSVITNALADS
jgi:enterochelin esterase family protein